MRNLSLIKFLTVMLTAAFMLSVSETKASGIDSLTKPVEAGRFLPEETDTGGILPLPPLDTLIAWAQIHSPLLKQQEALIEKNTADTKRVKKLLWDAVKLNSGIQYGNYGDPTINKLSTGYSSGASIQFSLFQLLSYKNNVQVYNAEKKVSVFKREEVAQDVAQLVTLLYNNTQGQKAILKIRSEGSYSAFSHMKMAEKEFNEGSVEVGELSRVTEIYTKAQVDYAQCLNDLKNDYMQLEILIGFPLSSYKPK